MALLLAAEPATAPPELRLALLWMGVACGLVILPFLLLAIRRATLGSSRRETRRRRARRAQNTDAWTEAGRRLVVEGGHGRLDDTVDLDPWGSDEDSW